MSRSEDSAIAPGEPHPAHLASRRREQGLRFVARVYPARVIGMPLGAIAVAVVFWTRRARPVMWLALGVGRLVWPHIVRARPGGSGPLPRRAEKPDD